MVIHFSNLKSYHEDLARNQPTRGYVKANPRINRELEEILAEKEVVVGGQHKMEYLVNWENLGDDGTSWDTTDDLKMLLQKIKDHATRSSRCQ